MQIVGVYDCELADRELVSALREHAQYDPRTRLLRYVNAGHNSPMVLRVNGRGSDVTRLEEGGTVVGLFPTYSYTEGKLAMEAGDVLVAYTDGISEAMNARDEEFDEENLIAALREHKARTAADLIAEILEHVDRFTAGARQHDDMTLLVVRVK